jgi:predicted phosphodiesterase
VVDHTHQYFAQYVGEKLVINPGSTLFNGTYCYLDTDSLIIKHESIYNNPKDLAKIWSSNGIEQRWMKEL